MSATEDVSREYVVKILCEVDGQRFTRCVGNLFATLVEEKNAAKFPTMERAILEVNRHKALERATPRWAWMASIASLQRYHFVTMAVIEIETKTVKTVTETEHPISLETM